MALLTQFRNNPTTIQAEIIRQAYGDILKEQNQRSSIIQAAQQQNQFNLRRMDQQTRDFQRNLSEHNKAIFQDRQQDELQEQRQFTNKMTEVASGQAERRLDQTDAQIDISGTNLGLAERRLGLAENADERAGETHDVNLDIGRFEIGEAAAKAQNRRELAGRDRLPVWAGGSPASPDLLPDIHDQLDEDGARIFDPVTGNYLLKEERTRPAGPVTNPDGADVAAATENVGADFADFATPPGGGQNQDQPLPAPPGLGRAVGAPAPVNAPPVAPGAPAAPAPIKVFPKVPQSGLVPGQKPGKSAKESQVRPELGKRLHEIARARGRGEWSPQAQLFIDSLHEDDASWAESVFRGQAKQSADTHGQSLTEADIGQIFEKHDTSGTGSSRPGLGGIENKVFRGLRDLHGVVWRAPNVNKLKTGEMSLSAQGTVAAKQVLREVMKAEGMDVTGDHYDTLEKRLLDQLKEHFIQNVKLPRESGHFRPAPTGGVQGPTRSGTNQGTRPPNSP